MLLLRTAPAAGLGDSSSEPWVKLLLLRVAPGAGLGASSTEPWVKVLLLRTAPAAGLGDSSSEPWVKLLLLRTAPAVGLGASSSELGVKLRLRWVCGSGLRVTLRLDDGLENKRLRFLLHSDSLSDLSDEPEDISNVSPLSSS